MKLLPTSSFRKNKFYYFKEKKTEKLEKKTKRSSKSYYIVLAFLDPNTKI